MALRVEADLAVHQLQPLHLAGSLHHANAPAANSAAGASCCVGVVHHRVPPPLAGSSYRRRRAPGHASWKRPVLSGPRVRLAVDPPCLPRRGGSVVSRVAADAVAVAVEVAPVAGFAAVDGRGPGGAGGGTVLVVGAPTTATTAVVATATTAAAASAGGLGGDRLRDLHLH